METKIAIDTLKIVSHANKNHHISRQVVHGSTGIGEHGALII